LAALQSGIGILADGVLMRFQRMHRLEAGETPLA
jgi:hypothetical protein